MTILHSGIDEKIVLSKPHKKKGCENRMSHVTVKPNEPFERALRRFKRKIEQDGILKQLKERKHYEKPSVRKRKKRRGKK